MWIIFQSIVHGDHGGDGQTAIPYVEKDFGPELEESYLNLKRTENVVSQ